MTDVEITPQADEHLEELDTEPRERVLKKLAEAQEWTDGTGGTCTIGTCRRS